MNHFQLIAFVCEAHSEQRRKYTGEPYLLHLLEVADTASKYCTLRGYSAYRKKTVEIAALCHDLLEDTIVTQELILNTLESCYGKLMADIVMEIIKECTDIYTKILFPSKNREERKTLEAKRLKNISKEAAIIKIFDYKSNISSIQIYDPTFAKVYELEKNLYLPFLIEKYDLYEI